MDFSSYQSALKKADLNDLLTYHHLYATRILELAPGQRAVVANGRIIGPLPSDETLLIEDFGLLEKFTLASHANVIGEQIAQWKIEKEEDKASDVVMRTSALIMADPVKKKRHWVVLAEDKASVVTIPASDETTAAFDIIAILDPLSRGAQRVAPLLRVLVKVINADIKLVMNCRPKLSEMPLKSFYRLVMEPELSFLPSGELRPGPSARFSTLPRKQLLTLNVAAPESWLVECVDAVHDLDNIRLDQVEREVRGEFELEHLLLEGHCFDDVTGNPPRGLQFNLGTDSQPSRVDTIVMANLGYFQLKANPGAWLLQLRPGRSADIYDIKSHDKTESPPSEPVVKVLINKFTGKIIRIRVQKKPDKLDKHLLVDGKDLEERSMWDTISDAVMGSAKKSTDVEEEDGGTINIFSLASGHLYERLLRIMMLSVLKHAKGKNPVKFWFLKNYLSPAFKRFLPYMAQHYGFEYELVQYKWPRWLHQQTEKQRIIWGYKILFLDVLFPLDVKKIIFVDADQVVRVNMRELMDLDLDGAPYGYTPFCSSRKEMDGFRFWKGGYWESHLAGRKYHISALYVVDLKKFRQIAAGDRLRGQYQGLSADPNSLANLDQDLPNNMIHQVKIKSLPQEWLWCETWCDDASKASAKTIDLCNNPQTKEPKLQAGMRIIAEWRSYDEELKALLDAFYAGQPPSFQPPPSQVTTQDKPKPKPDSSKSGGEEHGEL
jgi:UDP-glucose:glycoprotein glucosyltransferase